MDLDALIDAVRNHYLSRYREAIRDYRARFQPGGPEVLLEFGRDEDYVYRLYRFDLASGAVNPPNFTEVNPATHLEFDPAAFNVGGIMVDVSPFVWNGVEFVVSPPIKDAAVLQAWALRWIDPEETAIPDEFGLGAYVHSITAPEARRDCTSFSVDFGSAPLSCFYGLLDVLSTLGVKSVSIHSCTALGR